MVSTKTCDEGIKRDAKRQGSATETVKNESTRSFNHDGVWGTYCKKPCDTKETCCKLHGKPQGVGRNGGFKGGQQRGQAHLTHAEGHPYENFNSNS